MRPLIGWMTVAMVAGCIIDKTDDDDGDGDWGDDTALADLPDPFDADADVDVDVDADSDADSSIPGPDVTGKYNVQIGSVTGCDGESFWLEEWVPGPLTISGDPNALVFDWGSEIVLAGYLDENNYYSFAGHANVSFVLDDTGSEVEADLEILNVGLFEQDSSGCWEMTGIFDVVVDQDGLESTNCTVTGPVRGYQLQGVDCSGVL